MSAERLEHALLNKLITGEVGQEMQPTWTIIDAWQPKERGHAVANIVVGSVATIRTELYMSNEVELKASLAGLTSGGWDGTTVEDFFRDLHALSEELRKVLPTDEWKKYFEEMSFTQT